MEKISFDLVPKLYTIEETLVAEREARRRNGKNMATTGIPFFDDALCGIAMNDVLLIGAKSGVGKTQAAMNCAYKNAVLGKRVLYFALEAEEHEIFRRIKYQLVSHYFFNNRKEFPSDARLRYSDWYYDESNFDLNRAEEFADENMMIITKNLTAIYRTQNAYTVHDFEKHFQFYQNDFDLFVVDHVHYFDSDEPNENKALKETMKKIRDLALISSRPIVLVAHVRKSDTRNAGLIPSLEDFHGSSDLAKIATKAIAFAPCYDMKPTGTMYPTYLKVLKNRVGSDVERFAARSLFDISKNEYTKSYELGIARGDTFTALGASELPSWAKKPIKNEFGGWV